MPGKVNPVIAESLMMIAVQIIGNDSSITIAGQFGNFELLVMLPVMAYNLLQSIELLARGSENFSVRCVEGLAPNIKVCQNSVEQSLAMCTSLAPKIGYEASARIAKESYGKGLTIREVARAKKVISEEQLQEILDPWKMTSTTKPKKPRKRSSSRKL